MKSVILLHILHSLVKLTILLMTGLSLGQNASSDVPVVLHVNISAGKVHCANETLCDSLCKYASNKIKRDYSRGWAIRHQSIGQFHSRLNCTIAVEIGIARAELTTYLLRHVPSIREYHGTSTSSTTLFPSLLT